MDKFRLQRLVNVMRRRSGLDLTDSGPLSTTERGYDPAALHTLLDETRSTGCAPTSRPIRRPACRWLGLVLSFGVADTSIVEPGTVEALLERLDPVVERRGDVDVAVATNAGFAASTVHPLMSQEEQRAKLRLVRYYWGNEI